MFPGLADFTDLGLLLMRLMVALVFADSGWNHLKDPQARSQICARDTAGRLETEETQTHRRRHA